MNTVQLEVLRSGTVVADLFRLRRGYEFQYRPEFLASGESGIAINLPRSHQPLVREGLFNLPTFFAGMVPEGIIARAIRRSARLAEDDLFGLLAVTGHDAIGDISVRIPGSSPPPTPTYAESQEILTNLLHRGSMNMGAASAIPGIQPKLSVGQIIASHRGKHYLVKVGTPDFPDIVRNEHACMTLAARVGLRTAKTRIRDGNLLVERFDRTEGQPAPHVEDMLQVMDLYPNDRYALDYREILEAVKKVTGSGAAVLDALVLYAFSYLIGNGDLHGKNVSLMRQGSIWTITPAYDLVSTLPYADRLDGADRMALGLDERYGRFTLEHFIGEGSRLGLPEAATRSAILRTVKKTSAHARSIFDELGLVADIQKRCAEM